jgi:hypothetical protein
MVRCETRLYLRFIKHEFVHKNNRINVSTVSLVWAYQQRNLLGLASIAQIEPGDVCVCGIGWGNKIH